MAKEIIFLVEDAPEGGYTAHALGHSIFTEADTWEELKQAVKNAIWCHFDEAKTSEVFNKMPAAQPTSSLVLIAFVESVSGDFRSLQPCA